MKINARRLCCAENRLGARYFLGWAVNCYQETVSLLIAQTVEATRPFSELVV
jgi:hypothetical protein